MNDFYNVEYMSERVAALAKERDELRRQLKDRVEVVRCKDCKHRKMAGVSPYLYCCCADNDGLVGAVRDDDFCSYGERKE